MYWSVFGCNVEESKLTLIPVVSESVVAYTRVTLARFQVTQPPFLGDTRVSDEWLIPLVHAG